MPYFLHSLIMMLEKLPLLEDEGPSLLKVYEFAETPFLLASVALNGAKVGALVGLRVGAHVCPFDVGLRVGTYAAPQMKPRPTLGSCHE